MRLKKTEKMGHDFNRKSLYTENKLVCEGEGAIFRKNSKGFMI